MSNDNHDQDDQLTNDQKLEQLAGDTSDSSDAASILRENAQLVLTIGSLRKQIIKVWTIFFALALVFGVCVFIWLTSFPKITYIETKGNEPICALSATTDAYITPAVLADFAKEAAISAYEFDYLNYESNITRVSNSYFTETGRKAYLQSLDTSGNLERVIKGRLSLRAFASRAPQLEEQGMLDATTRYWIVTVPMVIEFYAGGLDSPRSKQDFLATVTISSVRPTAANIKGIGVDSMILKPYTPPRR